MKQQKFYIVLLIIVAMFYSGNAQNKLENFKLTDYIKPDPNIKIGKLENGLTYYIKKNSKPENRAELLLGVKAGAILEDDDQDGLAHFCEHMAFNGTKNFPKSQLINFLESTGIRFGADLNAYTSWDQTVYMLTLPTDNNDLMNNGFQVLEDWAHNVSYESSEIDKERGVILEEWRLGKGADDRVSKKHDPFLYYNSKYAKRDVIGDSAIILRADYDALRRFYREWYRPNLMTVICVGDFNVDDMEKKIKEHFGKLKNPDKSRERVQYTIPAHQEVFASVASDKELDFPRVQVYFKDKGRQRGTYEEFRYNVISSLFCGMLNSRLDELTRKPNSPFNFFAFSNEGQFLGKTSAFTLFAGAKGENINAALEAILTEAFRAKQHGFNQSELERVKIESLRSMEKAFEEKDKTNSKNYAHEYLRNFLNDESIPGIAVELELYKKWLPEITLNEVNALANTFIKNENLVITVSAPEREDVKIPTKDEVLATYNKLSTSKFDPYQDEASDKPLFNKTLTPGRIAGEIKRDEVGITEIDLTNGVKVILKPTDFKNDEIKFKAFAYGGTSLSSDADYLSAVNSANIINQSGISDFNLTQLQKKLAGKVVSVSPSIGAIEQRISGSASVKDMETMFQLIHLYFTDPKIDDDAFTSYLEQMKAEIQDSKNSPRSTFYDTVRYVLSNYHFRGKPMEEEMIKKINKEKLYQFYKERFSNAGAFTFVFVGNFQINDIKNMINKYIGSLPSKKQKETFKDLGMNPPTGKYTKTVKKGIEDQSTVMMILHSDFDWSLKNRFEIQAMIEVLNIRLREVVREDKSGTYGIGARANQTRFPKTRNTIMISFGCNPERVDELVKTVVDVIDELKKTKPNDSLITKVKEMQKREREVNLKENNFWLNALDSYYFNQDDVAGIVEYGKFIDGLTAEDVHKTAKKYFNYANFGKFILYPEDKKK